MASDGLSLSERTTACPAASTTTATARGMSMSATRHLEAKRESTRAARTTTITGLVGGPSCTWRVMIVRSTTYDDFFHEYPHGISDYFSDDFPTTLPTISRMNSHLGSWRTSLGETRSVGTRVSASRSSRRARRSPKEEATRVTCCRSLHWGMAICRTIFPTSCMRGGARAQPRWQGETRAQREALGEGQG